MSADSRCIRRRKSANAGKHELSALGRKFGDGSWASSRSRERALFLLSQPLHERGEVLAREFPLEGRGGQLVAPLERQQTLLHLIEVGEVVRGEHLALHDGEVDLDLVQPGGVYRSVDEPVGVK